MTDRRSGTRRALGLLLAGGLLLAAGSLDAHEGGAAGAPAASLRFQLVKYWPDREVQVLDRAHARLFVLSLERDEAYSVDLLRGEAVSRALERRTLRPAAGQPAPAWPGVPGGGGGEPLPDAGDPGRFLALGEAKPGAFDQGTRLGLFDGHTGRVYVVEDPTRLTVLDAVGGAVIARELGLSDGTGVAARVTLRRNEERAIEALGELARAQQRFREGDLDQDGAGDFGTLAELGAAGLIEAELATGELAGYAFALRVSADFPDLCWIATATPARPGASGERSFTINFEGAVHAAPDPLPLPEDCRIPPQAARVR